MTLLLQMGNLWLREMRLAGDSLASAVAPSPGTAFLSRHWIRKVLWCLYRVQISARSWPLSMQLWASHFSKPQLPMSIKQLQKCLEQHSTTMSQMRQLKTLTTGRCSMFNLNINLCHCILALGRVRQKDHMLKSQPRLHGKAQYKK